MERSRSAPLDALRGLAALAVLGYHVCLATVGLGAAGGAAGMLHFGVPVFFVLSGLLLYGPFVGARMDGERRPSLRGYALRRVARIVPAYWAALLGLGALGLIDVTGSDWWRYFGLLQIYDARTALDGLGPAWSLCIEVTFYAALPVLAVLAGLVARRRAGLGGELLPLLLLAVAGLVARALLGPESWNLLTTLPWFAAGMALAVVAAAADRDEATRRALETWSAPRRCWPAALACFALAAWHRGDPGTFVASGDAVTHLLIGAGAGLAVLGALHRGPSRLVGGLGHPLAIRLGVISYGVFLWHDPIANWLANRGFGPATVLVDTLLLTIAAATLSWLLVERPLLRRRPQPREVPEGAAVAALEA